MTKEDQIRIINQAGINLALAAKADKAKCEVALINLAAIAEVADAWPGIKFIANMALGRLMDETVK